MERLSSSLIVNSLKRFDQKYEMYKRIRWDETRGLRDVGRILYGPIHPKGSDGFTLKDFSPYLTFSLN